MEAHGLPIPYYAMDGFVVQASLTDLFSEVAKEVVASAVNNESRTSVVNEADVVFVT